MTNKPVELRIPEVLLETSAWESLDAKISIDQELKIQVGKTSPRKSTTHDHYLETSKGQKLYERVFPGEKAGRDLTIWLGYSDGKRCASVQFDRNAKGKQNTITISSSFMDEQLTGYAMRPAPFRYYFVGLTPLHEALGKAQSIGEAKVLGRNCEKYLFSSVPGTTATQELVYYLDDVTSVPLKVEAFADSSRLSASKPNWSWEATSFGESEGVHVCKTSQYRSYTKDMAERLSESYSVADMKLNGKYHNETFWPKYQDGVYINDLIQKTSYWNTRDKKPPASALVAQKPVPVEINAVAPDWSLPVVPFVFLLGLCIAIVVSIRFFRQRKP